MDSLMVHVPLIKRHNVKLFALNATYQQDPLLLDPDGELNLCEPLPIEELPALILCSFY